MSNSIEGKGFKIPDKFDVFLTIIGLIGLVTSLYLFWSKYLPMKESKTSYGFFIGVLLIASGIAFIFGAKSWKKRHDHEVIDEEKKRRLELAKKKLENIKLKQELKEKKR